MVTVQMIVLNVNNASCDTGNIKMNAFNDFQNNGDSCKLITPNATISHIAVLLQRQCLLH